MSCRVPGRALKGACQKQLILSVEFWNDECCQRVLCGVFVRDVLPSIDMLYMYDMYRLHIVYKLGFPFLSHIALSTF